MHSRSIPALAALLSLAFSNATTVAAQKPAKPAKPAVQVTDLIPANACAALAVRNLKELRTKGDDFVQKTKAKVPLRPSQGFAMALAGIGIKQGLDESGSAAVIFVNLKAIGHQTAGLRALEEGIVVVAPFLHLDQIAANYEIPPKDLADGKIVKKTATPKRWMGSYFAVRRKHLIIGNTEKAVQSVLTATPLSKELVASQRSAFSNVEILFHLGTKAWGDNWDDLLREIEKGVIPKNQEYGPESVLVRELAGAMKSLKFGLLGMRIENGLAFNVLAQFDREPTTRKVLQRIAGNANGSTLNGLPAGNVISAFAINGPASSSIPVAEAIIGMALRYFVKSKEFVSAAHQPALVGVFGEVWHRLKGSRAAMYRNPKPTEHGPYSLVAILETGDSKKFLADMRQLAMFVNRSGMKLSSEKGKGIDEATVKKLVSELGHDEYRVRTAATVKLSLIGTPALPYLNVVLKTSKDAETLARARGLKKLILAASSDQKTKTIRQDLLTRLKPKFDYYPASETRNGHAVDIVKLKLSGNNVAVQPSLRAVFGRDWDKVRIATIGNQAVVLLGTNTNLFEEAVNNLVKKRDGLAASGSFGRFRKLRDANSKVEFHLSVVKAAAAVESKKVGPAAGDDGLSALALSAGSEHLRLDVHFSMADVAAVLRKW